MIRVIRWPSPWTRPNSVLFGTQRKIPPSLGAYIQYLRDILLGDDDEYDDDGDYDDDGEYDEYDDDGDVGDDDCYD